jgi:amino acid transporter
MNVVILVSVISISVSGVYGGSRTLTALAQQGYAPKLFTYVDRSGRPLFSVIAILIFGGLAYVDLASSGEVVFTWLQALSGLAALFTWGSICLAHIRFRKAWAYHGHTLEEIPFTAVAGVWGSYLGLFLIVLVLAAQVSRTSTSPGTWLNGKLLTTAPSFMWPFHLSVRGLALPRAFSRLTSPFLLFSFSGRLATYGSGKAGYGRTRSMLIVVAGSTTGMRSMLTANNLPRNLRGNASTIPCFESRWRRVGLSAADFDLNKQPQLWIGNVHLCFHLY